MKNPFRIARLCLLAVFVLGLCMTGRHLFSQWVTARDTAEAIQLAGLTKRLETGQPPQPLRAAGAGASQTPLPEEAAGLAELDLEALRAANPEVLGWIEIPGTQLSYPLVQGEDNQYYLTHTWKTDYSSGGAVFLDKDASPDLSDFHSIVYAHRMHNDTMFGSLKYYDSQSYWQEHPNLYVVLEDGVYGYTIFSAREASVNGIVYRKVVEKSGMKDALLRSCLEDSVLDTGVTPASTDKILTLSTCTAVGHANRWVVHAVLQNVWRPERAA